MSHGAYRPSRSPSLFPKDIPAVAPLNPAGAGELRTRAIVTRLASRAAQASAWAAPGFTSDRKVANAQPVSQLGHIVRPVEQHPIWFWVRDSVARPLRRDQADAGDLGYGVTLGEDQPRAGRAVKEEQGAAVWITETPEPEGAPV